MCDCDTAFYIDVCHYMLYFLLFNTLLSLFLRKHFWFYCQDRKWIMVPSQDEKLTSQLNYTHCVRHDVCNWVSATAFNKAKHLRLHTPVRETRRSFLVGYVWVWLFFHPSANGNFKRINKKRSLASTKTLPTLSAHTALSASPDRARARTRHFPPAALLHPACVNTRMGATGSSPTQGQALGKDLPKDKVFLIILIRSIIFFNLKVLGHCN